MARSKVSIVNQALTLLRAEVISSFDDGTPEANAASRNFDSVVDTVMYEAAWGFAIKDAVLRKVSDDSLRSEEYRAEVTDEFDPPAQYSVFALPADFLGLVKVRDELRYTPPSSKYININAEDATEVVITYQRSVPVDEWPGWFVQPVVLKLAQTLAIVAVDDFDRGAYFERLYQTEVDKLRRFNSRGKRPVSWLDKFRPLSRDRRYGGDGDFIRDSLYTSRSERG